MTADNKLSTRRVYIRITNQCNKDCSFCFYKNDPKQSAEISLETLKGIIRKEYAMHDKSTPLIVELTGGEPTLHTNYKALATYIANLAPGLIKLRFETNGTNLDDQEFLEFAKLFKQGHTRLKVSFNSELIDSDPQWLPRLVSFSKYATELNLNFALGIRYKNKEDKQRLEKLIEEFNIKTIFDQPLSYPIRDINLYRDGRMANYNILWVLYDSDGEKIYESPCK